MNKTEIVARLERQYPNKHIICIPEEHPKEIICELERTPEQGIAVAVIDASELHFHRRTKEVYEILEGKCPLFVDGKRVVLCEGDQYIVSPGTLHRAEGSATWVKVITTPAWDPSDHILA